LNRTFFTGYIRNKPKPIIGSGEKANMVNTSVARLRTIGLIEGISFLLLLGVAMPLKYFAGIPKAVTWAGWLHGLLFIGFCIALSQAHQEARWGFGRSLIILIAALLPFGPFVIDKRLRREDESLQKNYR
jgi:integral membrane protein